MPLFEFEGKRPTVHPDAFIAPTATLIGDVTVEKGASVWYGAVLRADICTIVIGEGANIQDNSVLHAAPGTSLVVGANSTVGHGCIVHCAEVGEQALIGNGSTLLGGAEIGARRLIAAGPVVTARPAPPARPDNRPPPPHPPPPPPPPRPRTPRRMGPPRPPPQPDQADRGHL